ncbi:hypothetical protein HHL21_16895 [Massilia sp. RP-1-19]|uniref:DUF1453 domain-containing protein n=1 Tax=Massilia polaris TaxID=2728846 RepID=A0A848HLF0_9BURK|nr:hypothetical protein [Massilia polaris]NML62726.1 hypothetical protein [Massilia polaris]
MNIQTIVLLILVPLLMWRVYARLKRMMARQQSVMSRHWTGLAVFAAMVLVPGSELLSQPASLGWLAVGTAAGTAYGIWGLRKTRYEVTPEGYFFTPNERLGMLVAMLFVGRIIYVGLEIFVNQGSANTLPRFTDSPLTLVCLGVFAGYFGAYSAGMLRWRYAMKKAAASD